MIRLAVFNYKNIEHINYLHIASNNLYVQYWRESEFIILEYFTHFML